MSNIKITDVRFLPGDSAFLIDDGKTSILYDSGFAFTGYEVLENIKKVLGERKLDYIFLTHSHYDHALGSVYVKKSFPDVKIVAGEYAATIFTKPSARTLMRELDKKFAKKCGIDEYEDLIDELKVDITVKDNDVIRAGNMEFTVIELPGHTKCSVGYFLAKEKLLLGCETIGVYNGEDDVIPSYLVGYKMTLDSIKKAQMLGARAVLIPHYGVIEGDLARKYMKNAKESAVITAQTISSMLKNKKTKEDVMKFFKDKFYQGYVRKIYPKDAMELNTRITIDLIEKEFNT